MCLTDGSDQGHRGEQTPDPRFDGPDIRGGTIHLSDPVIAALTREVVELAELAVEDLAHYIAGAPGKPRAVTEREAAWDLIHDRLPPRWRVGPPSLDPATRKWRVVAIGPTHGRRKVHIPPDTITGEGPDEVAALQDLAGRLGVGTG